MVFVPKGGFHNAYGQPVKQLFELEPFKFLEPTYTQWEADHFGYTWPHFARKNWWIPCTAVGLYALLITLGPRIMKDRKPFDLRLTLAAWNLALSVFSFIGMFRTVPHLMYNVQYRPFRDTVCTVPNLDWGTGATCVWVIAFILSKIPELIDTVFIVLRKKKLIFLHWYHHITVLLYCWHSLAYEPAGALYFIAMNYTVHALMYGYYFLMAIKSVPRWFNPMLITGSQITQMFVGTFVCASTWFYAFGDKPCANTLSNRIAGTLMYGSYLYLFADFAVRRYILRQPPTKQQAIKEKQ